jgi:peptidyl-prolyl cis-trans isomerase C
MRAITWISIGLVLLGTANGLGVSESADRRERPAQAKDHLSRTIVQVKDYVVTVNDLEQRTKAYPAGSLSSRESKLRLVESLITTKLFSLAARAAKFDAAEDFPKAKEQAQAIALADAYLQRYVKPKLSEEAARKYFSAHKDEFQDFSYSRQRIMPLLRDQVLTATNQSLMQEWGVKLRDDVLKDLDLRNAKECSLVLAQIGPTAITVGDLKQFAAQYPAERVSAFQAKKYLLDVLVLERLYALAAEKAGLAKEPEVQKMLAWSEDQLLAERYLRFVQDKITLEDARRYYEAHPEEFKGPEQLWLRQIVVATQEEALAVKAKLDRGDRLEEVAQRFSTDRASAAKGGDIGWVRKGRLHSEVERVAFQLKPKQVSEPIKTPGGYYVVRVEERLKGVGRPFD